MEDPNPLHVDQQQVVKFLIEKAKEQKLRADALERTLAEREVSIAGLQAKLVQLEKDLEVATRRPEPIVIDKQMEEDLSLLGFSAAYK